MSPELIARRKREYASAVDGFARANGIAPPHRWEMTPVQKEKLQNALGAMAAEWIIRHAFEAAREKLGVSRALDMQIEDHVEDIVWVIAIAEPVRG